MKSNKKVNILLWLDYIAFAIIVIVFFVISYCGFYYSDDITMAYGGVPAGLGEKVGEISSIFDVFKLTWSWYFHWGGRIFSVAAQYFFCGLLGNKVWFDIVNTLFFMLLMIICSRLTNDDNNNIRYVLVFALLFWFLCPQPDETLFWVAGSTTHFWANTLAFAFLLLFLKYKDDDFNFVGKIGLLFFSIFAAAEFIPCASICGAIVVYYAFHFKSFKGNAVPLVVGFAIGSIIMLFAPGNFGRASEGNFRFSFLGSMQDLIYHPIREIVKYKALWMFLIILICGWIKNKVIVKSWMKNNSFLLLSLGWSVIAFSVVFRPAIRALFFPETLALVLFLRFLFDNYQIFEIRILNEIISNNRYFIRSAIIIVLFVVFMMDSAYAIAETKKQCKNNDVLLNEIANSNGVVVLDRMNSSHRMANSTGCSVYEWTWEPLADKFGLDSVHLYPSYCQDKYYKQAHPMDNIYIDEINYNNDSDLLGKYIRMIVRIKNEELQASNNHVTFTIDYTRPRKWYKSWLDKWRNYRYDRTDVVERDIPDICFDGYSYYMIFFGRENVKGLKSVKYTIE